MGEESEIWYIGSGYFHQDYDVAAESSLALVAKFVAVETRETSQSLLDELNALLESAPTEQEAQRIWLTEAGADYLPTHDGMTYLQWLTRMRDIVREELTRKP